MLGLSVVPSVVQFVGFLFLPESPRWLLQKGRSQEARQVLSRIRGGQNVDVEYETIRNGIEEEEEKAGGGERFQKITTQQHQDKTLQTLERNEGMSYVKYKMFACLFCRRSCYFADPPPQSDSQGSDRRLRPPDVSAAVWHKHRHVGHLFIL